MQLNIEEYEEKKAATLLKYGFPKEALWLTECELCEDGKTGVVYSHESGNVYGVNTFTDEVTFEEACRNLVKQVFG